MYIIDYINHLYLKYNKKKLNRLLGYGIFLS